MYKGYAQKHIGEIDKKIFMNIRCGNDILEVSKKFNTVLYMIPKLKIICPITWEYGCYLKNYIPISQYLITDDDIISWTINIKYKTEHIMKAGSRAVNFCENNYNYVATSCSNEIFDSICNILRPDTYIPDITKHISEIIKSYDLSSIEDLCGMSLKDNTLIIPNIVPTNEKMKIVARRRIIPKHNYFIDLYLTNLNSDIESEILNIPTLFYYNHFCDKKERLYTAKLRSNISKQIIRHIREKYNKNMFQIMDVYDHFGNTKELQSTMRYLSDKGYITPVGARYSKIDGINIIHRGNTYKVLESETTQLT